MNWFRETPESLAALTEERAEIAWLDYRDDYQRKHPWCDARRAGRQMRKRDFIAGFLAATAIPDAAGANKDGAL